LNVATALEDMTMGEKDEPSSTAAGEADSKPAGAAKKTKAAKKGKRGKSARAPRSPGKAYPSVPLEKALQIAYQIKEKNGGNPWSPDQVAAAIGSSPKSSEFYYITAAARDYGLTVGTRDTKEIALTDLGKEIVYAPNPATEHAKKVEAFHSVELFKKVLTHYKGSALPEMKYLGNTLEREFGVAPQHHEDFSKVFRDNTKYLDIKSGDAPATDDANESPTTLIVGEPKQKSSLKAFVIMPFSEKNPERARGFFEEVLRSLITPAGLQAGFNVETANRQGSDIIQSTIVNELLEADLVIADLTDHNPNVLFELGLRMAGDKPVALIKAVGTGRVFDVDNMLRVYEYQPQLWRSTVESDVPELVKHFKTAWENRATDMSYMKVLRKMKTGGSN
jgi:nucleoside 2-deoxyribosyltransferase